MSLRTGFGLVLTVAVLGSAAGCRIQPIQDADVVADAAVVSVIARHGRHGSAATGFAISPTRIVTARHVIEGEWDLYVRLADQRQVAAKAVVAESEEHDFAVLEIEETPGLPALAWSDAEPREGGRYRCVSSLGARAQTVTPVTPVGKKDEKGRSGVVGHWRGALGPGASGAPILDERGRVAGVVVGGEMESADDPWDAVPARIASAIRDGPRWTPSAWGEKTAAEPGTRARRVLHAAGKAYLEERYEDVLAELERGFPDLAGDPSYAEDGLAHIVAGLQVLHREGEIEARLRRAVKEYPDRPWSHGALAEFLVGKEQHEEALKEVREVLKLKDDLDLRLWLAARLMQLRRHAEAEAESRSAVTGHPESASAHNHLARALAFQSLWAKAEHEAREAVRLEPTSSLFHGNLGIVLCYTDRLDEAGAELTEAARLDTRFAEPHEWLARLHLHRRESDAAKKEIEILRGLDAAAATALEKEIAASKGSGTR